MNETALTFSNFTFTYKVQTAPTLYNVDLTIRKGEKTLILGHSGSGKSTLAHCINGLIPHAFDGASSGSLFVLGEDAGTLDIFSLSKKVGTVLQDTDGQFVGLNAAEDIAFAAENDCLPADEMHTLVFDTAKLVNIENHLKKSPQNLSGGQKQRVSIAGVLIDQVEILLFDEPLANLDPAAGKQTIELIDDLHKQTNKTIIIIEHRLEDVLHRSVDRIVVLEKGRVIADMKPETLLASTILRDAGMREPLYISALRYAGITITEDRKPTSVSSIEFDSIVLQKWDQSLDEKPLKEKAPPLLEIKNLSFRYGTPEESPNQNGLVLDDVSFSIEKGAIAALAGKNGAGKSTLAKLVCGFDKPTSGNVFFDGNDLAPFSIKERAERIGYVMQNPNQMISFPLIFDEVAFGLRNRGTPENEVTDRVGQTLNICGLYPFKTWPIRALSFGQKKRLTIASILVMGPAMLILDEPTAGQDFRNYARIMEFVKKLNAEQGITLLMITHDMHLMLEYTSRAIVIADGRLIADDEPAIVLSDRAKTEAASLKRTSLYDLAVRAHIADAEGFVRRFIAYEQRNARLS
ncbi:MAG: ABC transporter ATP-binding protein [Treponema sp.]|jgi:energy-coupling factor transport system ATP-binding protein|nr:ABC transporter ATP-binding protein [Treponema sp.]